MSDRTAFTIFGLLCGTVIIALFVLLAIARPDATCTVIGYTAGTGEAVIHCEDKP